MTALDPSQYNVTVITSICSLQLESYTRSGSISHYKCAYRFARNLVTNINSIFNQRQCFLWLTVNAGALLQLPGEYDHINLPLMHD